MTQPHSLAEYIAHRHVQQFNRLYIISLNCHSPFHLIDIISMYCISISHTPFHLIYSTSAHGKRFLFFPVSSQLATQPRILCSSHHTQQLMITQQLIPIFKIIFTDPVSVSKMGWVCSVCHRDGADNAAIRAIVLQL